MNVGFFKIHRKIKKWEWYSEPNVFCLFMHLLVDANFEDRKWQGKTVKAGQLITSLESLGKSTGLSVQQIRTALNKLKSTNEITIQTTSNYSIITIINWHEYQDGNTPDNKPITNEQQTDNNQITTPKEVKKLRSKEVVCSSAPADEKNDFQKIYEAGSAIFPKLATANTSAIHQWITNGCHAELDAIPEIKRHAGKQISSWSFFTAPIANAKATREAPLPQGNNYAKPPPDTLESTIEKVRKKMLGEANNEK